MFAVKNSSWTGWNKYIDLLYSHVVTSVLCPVKVEIQVYIFTLASLIVIVKLCYYYTSDTSWNKKKKGESSDGETHNGTIWDNMPK